MNVFLFLPPLSHAGYPVCWGASRGTGSLHKVNIGMIDQSLDASAASFLSESKSSQDSLQVEGTREWLAKCLPHKALTGRV